MKQEDAMKMNNEQAIEILTPLRNMMIDQNGCPISDAVFALDKAIEALQERKRGEWIEETVIGLGVEHYHGWRCSECGEHCYPKSRFCPNCGADMRGAE